MIIALKEKLSGIVAVAIIAIIAIPLAFFGVEQLFLSGNKVVSVGSVNGKKITELELLRSVANNEERIRQLLGENFSEDLIDAAQLEDQAIKGLIEFKLYQDHAEDSGMGITDNFAVEQIRSIPQFQIDNQFSDLAFRNFVNDRGHTATTFVDAFRDDFVAQQLIVGIQTSAFATQSMLQSTVAITQEKRSYQTILLPVTSVLDAVEVPDADVAFFYEENTQDFSRAEQVSLNYLTLSPSNFTNKVDVSEAEIEARFELIQAARPVRREAAHILIEEQSEDAHLAILDKIQEQLEAGVSFGELAAEYSADQGSAANAGALGFTTGDIFPAAFEEALADLSVGQVSSPVLTEAGFHIVKLLGIQSDILDLELERANIDREIRAEKAADVYRASLDSLRDIIFSADSLEQVVNEFADTAALTANETGLFNRQSGQGVAQQESVRAAAFSTIVLEEGLSEMIETSDTETLVINLRERVPAGVAPLAEVREDIIEQLKIQGGTALLQEKAEAIVARLKAGEETEAVATEEELEWNVQIGATRGVGGSASEVVFAAPITTNLPVAGSSVLGNGDHLIYLIEGVAQGTLDDFNELQRSQLAAQLGQSVGNSELSAYSNSLKANARIKMKVGSEY